MVILMKKKYAAAVSGCRTNQYELQSMKTQLEAEGFAAAREGEEADLCVIHTCAVTESAESSSRHAVRALVHKHPGALIVVTGCLAQKDPVSLRALSENVEIISNDEKEYFFEKLFPGKKAPQKSITTFEGHTRAFVQIQDGCNCYCSYCIVPYLRGPSQSRAREEILREIKTLLASSYKEIVITGVNVGDFLDCGSYGLIDLLGEVDTLPGVERLRLSSINPNDIDERFLQTLSGLKSFCPSMHLVLQSGSNAILKKMRRQYTRESYCDLVKKLRKTNPDFCFSTDVIVGFPGETDADFEETVEVVRDVGFAKVHIFPYSRREGTQAARLGKCVPHDVIKDRKRRLADVEHEVSLETRARFVGRTVSVLTENGDDPTWICGQTPHGLVVKVPRENLSENTLLRVELTDLCDDFLLGKVIL